MNESAQALQIWSQHIHGDDLPWVTNSTGQFRVLQANLSDNFIVSEWLFEAGRETRLHLHRHPVFAFTYSGNWGHRPNDFEYRRGTYVYEPLNVLHRFHNGPEKTHCMFVINGDIEILDPDSQEVIERITPATTRTFYLEACEREGRPRPNLLT